MALETKTSRFARAKAHGRDVDVKGLRPEHPDYGAVQIIEKTVVRKMRSDGYPDKKHKPQVTETILMELAPEEAVHLLRTLTDAVVESRTVTSGLNPRPPTALEQAMTDGPTICRVDRHTIMVGERRVTASPEQEARIRAMDPEQRSRFLAIMGGPTEPATPQVGLMPGEHEQPPPVNPWAAEDAALAGLAAFLTPRLGDRLRALLDADAAAHEVIALRHRVQRAEDLAAELRRQIPFLQRHIERLRGEAQPGA